MSRSDIPFIRKLFPTETRFLFSCPPTLNFGSAGESSGQRRPPAWSGTQTWAGGNSSWCPELESRTTHLIAKLLLDPQQLVVLCQPLGPAGRAGFDLASAQSDRQVRDEGVLLPAHWSALEHREACRQSGSDSSRSALVAVVPSRPTGDLSSPPNQPPAPAVSLHHHTDNQQAQQGGMRAYLGHRDRFDRFCHRPDLIHLQFSDANAPHVTRSSKDGSGDPLPRLGPVLCCHAE